MKKLSMLLFICILCGYSANDANDKKAPDSKQEQPSSKVVEQQEQETQDEDMIYFEHEGYFAHDLRDTAFAYENSIEVAIIHVDRIDGVETYSSVFDAYITPQTFGKATILKSFKNVLDEQQEITFYRTGGKVEFNEFVKTRPEKEQEMLLKMEKKPKYVKEYFTGDIDVEEGKTYLAYLVEDSDIHNDGAYAIVHYQTGLREVKDTKSQSGSSIQVRNNFTNEWENLDDIIDL